MKLIKTFIITLFSLIFFFSEIGGLAAEEKDPGKETVYVAIEPYLITNFTKKNGRLGYLNTLPRIVTIKANEKLVDDNMPLIKDFLVEFLGAQPEEKLKDVRQRAALQKEAIQGLRKLFKEEVGKPVVDGLIFKKFLTM